MPLTPRLHSDLKRRRVANHSRQELRLDRDLLPIFHRVLDTQAGDRLRDGEIDVRVRKRLAGADTSSEPECKRVGVSFRDVAVLGEEAFRLECHRVVVDGWVVHEAPVHMSQHRHNQHGSQTGYYGES